MKYTKLLLGLLIVCSALTSIAAAAPGQYVFSNWFDLGYDSLNNDLVHYNTSFIANTNPSTTIFEWYFITAVALIFLTLGLIMTQRKEAKDIDIIFLIMGTMASLISAMTSNAIDIVTGYGVVASVEGTNSSQVVSATTTLSLTNNTQEFVSMTQHTVYNFNLTGLFMWMVVCIGVLCIFAAYMRRSVKEIESPEM